MRYRTSETHYGKWISEIKVTYSMRMNNGEDTWKAG